MATRFLARVMQMIKTETEWLSLDPVILLGEWAVVKFEDQIKVKIGDGESKFSELSYGLWSGEPGNPGNPGNNGLSAYELYLEYTTDDPVLTEEQFALLISNKITVVPGSEGQLAKFTAEGDIEGTGITIPANDSGFLSRYKTVTSVNNVLIPASVLYSGSDCTLLGKFVTGADVEANSTKYHDSGRYARYFFATCKKINQSTYNRAEITVDFYSSTGVFIYSMRGICTSSTWIVPLYIVTGFERVTNITDVDDTAEIPLFATERQIFTTVGSNEDIFINLEEGDTSFINPMSAKKITVTLINTDEKQRTVWIFDAVDAGGAITYNVRLPQYPCILRKNETKDITIDIKPITSNGNTVDVFINYQDLFPLILTAETVDDETVEFLDENGENLQSLLRLSPPYLLEFLAQVKDGQTNRVFKGLCWYNDDYQENECGRVKTDTFNWEFPLELYGSTVAPSVQWKYEEFGRFWAKGYGVPSDFKIKVTNVIQ